MSTKAIGVVAGKDKFQGKETGRDRFKLTITCNRQDGQRTGVVYYYADAPAEIEKLSKLNIGDGIDVTGEFVSRGMGEAFVVSSVVPNGEDYALVKSKKA